MTQFKVRGSFLGELAELSSEQGVTLVTVRSGIALLAVQNGPQQKERS